MGKEKLNACSPRGSKIQFNLILKSLLAIIHVPGPVLGTRGVTAKERAWCPDLVKFKD